jgi:hypothetical protein
MAGEQDPQGQQASATAPAWHPDPYGGASHRWWDGTAWADDVGPAEQQFGLRPMAEALDESLFLDQRNLISGNDVLRTEDGVHFGLLHKPFVGNVTGHSAHGSWTFDRQGVTQNQLEIRVLPANVAIARFEWQGIGTGTSGTLVFNDQRWFGFLPTHDVQTRLEAGAGFDREVVLDRGVEGVGYSRDRVLSGGAWSFFEYGQGAGITTSRLEWPGPSGRILHPGDVTTDTPVTITTSGTGNTTAEVFTDVFETGAGRRELPLLVLLSTYLVWWTAVIRED